MEVFGLRVQVERDLDIWKHVAPMESSGVLEKASLGYAGGVFLGSHSALLCLLFDSPCVSIMC